MVLAATASAGGRAEAGSLYVGTNYSPPFNFTLNGISESSPGGNITPSTLNGVALPYLYCIAEDVNIYVGNTYKTTVSTTGYYNGHLMNNAGQIAWLMTNLAPSATTLAEQEGLQGAIWQQVYGSNFVFDQTNNDPNVIAAFNADIAALDGHTAPWTVCSG